MTAAPDDGVVPGGSAVMETASCEGVHAMDRLVRRVPSELCPFDIVKRVVTVKQVRPSPLRRGEVGPGHGYAKKPMREHRRGGVGAQLRGWRSEIGGRKSEASAAWPDVMSSDI
jgi:hypothetical protein